VVAVRTAAWVVLVAACRSASPASPDAFQFVGPDPGILPGAADRFLLIGTIVTPGTVLDGAVLVEGSQITCVDTVAACSALPGATGATIINTAGIIAPGLIDTHNHILFDIFDGDDWLPAQVYQDHDQWPNEARYKAMLDVKQCLADDSQGRPAWCAMTPYGTAAGSLRCEIDKWGELKGVIAGTTSIVGLPGTSGPCFGSLARSVDTAQSGLATDKIQTSALFPPSGGTGVCTNVASGKTAAFLVHVGEGTDAKALGELAQLGSSTTPANCLYAPQTAITHGTAFTATEFAQMATTGMKLTWSPASNVALYGATTNIPAALDAGLTIALAPDWSMGGSQNLLDELRFAQAWNASHWQDARISPQALVGMVTTNAAKVLALDGQLGAIAVGQLADLAVFAGDPADPFAAIVAAHPTDVRLVMVGGVVQYGDALLARAGPATCEALDVCGAPKFLCAATASSADKLGQTKVEIEGALQSALTLADSLTPDGFDFAPLAPLVRCP